MHAATIAGVFRTTDCWATFAAVGPLIPLRYLEYKPGNTDVIYVSGASHFYKSSDNCVSFTHISYTRSFLLIQSMIMIAPDKVSTR